MNCSHPVAFLCVVVTLAAASPVCAQEAPTGTPPVELGLDVVFAGPDGFDRARTILAPRVTMNLSPRTALSISGDAFVSRQYIEEAWTDSRVITAELRRGLVQTGRFAMSGLVGGGYGWSRFFQPEYSYVIRNEPVVVAANTFTTSGPELTLGVGFEQRVAARLALRQEVRVVLGEVSEFRAHLGVSVPIGRYPREFDRPLTRTGQRPDSLRNGTGIGALVGAAVMTGFAAFLANALCEGDCENLGLALAAGAVYGAGGGALTGAMIDSFRE